MKSVKSINQGKSLLSRRAVVIQTISDIAKAHRDKLSAKTRRFTLITVLFFIARMAFSQDSDLHRLRLLLGNATGDKDRIALMIALCDHYSLHNFDSAKFYGERAYLLAEQIAF